MKFVRMMMRPCFVVFSAMLVLAFAIPATAAAEDTSGGDPAAQPAPETAPEQPAVPEYEETILSDEKLLSQWAFVRRRAWAYRKPLGEGGKVRRLTTRTPDRTHELVLVLKQRVYPGGKIWVQVRLPMRGSGRKGWVKRRDLAAFKTVRTRLVVDRRRFTAKLYKDGREVWRSRIGVGKRGTATPRGHFYIRNRLISNNPGGPYGPYAMGLSAYSATLSDWPGGGVVGIHGTNQPGLIPGRISHGCVRVPNKRIRKLFKLLPAGTPVRIL